MTTDFRINKPTISLFGPGIRTDRWMGLYESIATSKVDFDLTMIGHVKPQFTLPDNFHYIYSLVKPAQCAEIGFRYSSGDLVLPVADDEILSNGALDSVYKTYMELNNPLAMVSFRFVLQGEDLTSHTFSANRYDVKDPDSPIVPLCPLMSRDLWKKIGGIDRRFIALYWDLDLAMRVHEIGGTVVISQDASIEEVGKCVLGGEHKLYDIYGPPYDRHILDSFWKIVGARQAKRLAPVEPFEDRDLLTISQGPKGEWI